ncbi:MAG: lytic transglycosylase domain-containing protein, partial [Acidobacteriota bacterium]
CARRRLDFHLVSAVVRAESDFRQYILSRKGAIGLMQLMPATAKAYGVHDPWNVEQNLSGGTAFLKDLLKQFNGNIPLALAAYNAGSDAVLRFGNRIPPYRETVHYVFTILHDFGRDGLVDKARALLYRPSDYQRYYLATRGERPDYTVFYMSLETSGAWHIYDYPPAGVKTVPVVVKEDW